MSADPPDRPYRRHGPRRPTIGSAAGAISRPRPARRDRRPTRSTAGRRSASASSRYGENGVPSLGEARAHRRLKRDEAHQERREIKRSAARHPSRTRTRRTIRTTKPFLVNRFGAGRPRARLIWTLLVLVLVLSGVLAKVGLMQGTGGEVLRAQAAELWTRSRELPAQRGTIFDRNGDELALSVPGSTVAVNPRQVLNPAGTIEALGDLLNLSEERREELLNEMST